jgi:hypothetical protein
VTAKLSKKFYDALGEDVANELVDWFNQVDATYRADLRELNDLNFQRFDAKMGERLALLEATFERRFAVFESTLEVKFGAKLEKGLNALRGEVAGLRSEVRSEVAGLRSEVRSEVAGLRSEVSSEMDGLRSELMEHLVSHEQLAAFRAEMADRLGNLRSDLLRWMFVSWTGVVLAVITATILG